MRIARPDQKKCRTFVRQIRILLSLVAALSATAAQSRDFSSADVHPLDYPTAQAVTYMGKRISERTGGRYSIRVLAQGQGSENYSIQQVRNGMLDMTRVNVATLTSIVPATIVPSLPFLFKSTAHMRRVLDGPIGNEILAGMEQSGFIGLCFYDAGSRSFYSSGKPIRTVADMKGMKVRVPQSGILAAVVQAMGAEAMPMPYDRVYAALKAGVVDAAENNWPSYLSARHYETAKIYSLTEHSMLPSVLVFSKKVWDGLSEEDQVIIRAVAKESMPYMRELWDEREAWARKTVEAAGTQIVSDVDKKSFIDAVAPVYMKFTADPKLQNLVKRIQAAD
jgi:tripartite ATP-independent transporter DctP family solute receptor